MSAVPLHELIKGGIPFSVIPHLLRRDELLEATGVNLRTMQRYPAGLHRAWPPPREPTLYAMQPHSQSTLR